MDDRFAIVIGVVGGAVGYWSGLTLMNTLVAFFLTNCIWAVMVAWFGWDS